MLRNLPLADRDETVLLIEQAGGKAVAVQLDHTREEDVAEFAVRIRHDAGRLDVLVDSIWGADPMIDWSRRFWEVDLTNEDRRHRVVAVTRLPAVRGGARSLRRP